MKTKTYTVKKFKFLVMAAFILSSLTIIDSSCKIEKDGGAQPQDDTPHIDMNVTTHQVAFLYMEEGKLRKNEYAGVIGEEQVTVSKVNDTTASFYVPGLVAGQYELVLQDLNIIVDLDISETVLSQTPGEVINILNLTFVEFLSSIPDTAVDKDIINQAIQSFQNVVENASEYEKMQMALYYTANKEVFDVILNDDSERSVDGCVFCFSSMIKFKVSVLLFGAGVVIAVAAPEPIEKALGAGIAIIGWKKAKFYLNKMTVERIKVIGFVIGEIQPLSPLLNVNNNINFTKDEEKFFSIDSENRAVINEDRNDINDNYKSFFGKFDFFIESIITLNEVIEFINEYVPFSNINTLPIPVMQTNSTLQTYPIEQETYDNLSITADHDKITVDQFSFDGLGQISITILADESLDLSNPVDFWLNITYQDDYNEMTQSVSATLTTEDGEYYTDPRDGQTYNIVDIGSQTWFAENLNYETANSWWYDNSSANGDIYGRLYTWEAALTACPSGWSLPSDDEWKQMEMALGMSQSEADGTYFRGTDEGKKMKSTSGWYYNNGNGTNSSGFTALPGGYRSSSGSFSYLGYGGYWWSSSEYSGTGAWDRGLYYGNVQVSRYYDSKPLGFSVRCLKN